MGSPTDPTEFSGILGRINARGDALELRIYPHAFSTAPDGKYVLVATFDGAAFQESELSPFIGEEVEGTLFDDRAVLVATFQTMTLNLTAKAVRFDWASYDEADFIRRVDELDDAHERLNTVLTKALRKERAAIELVQELLRRANLKAQSSPEHADKQAAAISVLERLLRQLENDD